MHSAAVPTLVALAIQSVLGLVVFQANPWRKPNQCFFLLSTVIGVWLACLYFSFSATTSAEVAFYIREASAAGALILTVFNLLRVSIRQQNRRWQEILGDAWIWLIAAVAAVIFCQTKFFLEGARFSRPPGASIAFPVPVYGQEAVFYFLYFVIAGLIVIINYARDVRQTTGSNRAELAFILTGAVVAIATTFSSFSLGFFIDRSRLVGFAPFRIVFFSLIVAYGIATRKIMEAGFFLRRAISYGLLAAYLLALYGLIWWLVDSAFEPLFGISTRSAAHVTAAVAVAFAMASARGLSQSLADRLFISTRGLDFRTTMNQAVAILKSVITLHDLLTRFGKTIAQAVDTDRVMILLPQKDVYAQHYPLPTPASQIDLPKDHALLKYLQTSGQPIVLDELHRARPTPESDRVSKHMQHLNLAVVMGIFAREQLEGIMLLGPRLSGRIYGRAEQEALQALCGQLAVAIENAQLFTEVQNAKIYNETLLENLTTGVIASGIDERITVFNNEAGQITKVDAKAVLDHTIDRLPLPLYSALGETLRTGEGQENSELFLDTGADGVTVRASTSIFHGQDKQVLGALMVLTDITALKRLEQQIRRSDRLASLGTLSAGMAHEIKNPLVSIKTFAQLLPERYQDSDFRETFSNLIGHEIDRIDSLVNQLLRFARPAKPLLKPMHVHAVLEKPLQLVGHRLFQKALTLTRSSQADVDTLNADAAQLEQVFLNFFLNAMDAMKRGGEMEVSTEIRPAEGWVATVTSANGDVREILRITIRDNGEGIRREDIPHVFDPFFTTKDYGTGLGLSVVHGIIQEHGGQIEVESELDKGTAFHISLPLVRFDSKVAAA